MKPIRIQRKRTKGWKMPTNTIYVGRPSKWGNYCKIGSQLELADENHNPIILAINNLDESLYAFRRYWEISIAYSREFKKEHPLAALRGKDLACWCPLDKPCHADILIELANKNELTPESIIDSLILEAPLDFMGTGTVKSERLEAKEWNEKVERAKLDIEAYKNGEVEKKLKGLLTELGYFKHNWFIDMSIDEGLNEIIAKYLTPSKA